MNFGRSSLLGKSFTDSNNAAFVHSSLGFLFRSCLGSLYAKRLKLQPTKVDLISNNQGRDKPFWFKPQIITGARTDTETGWATVQSPGELTPR